MMPFAENARLIHLGAGLIACVGLIAPEGAALAQAGSGVWRDGIYATVQSAEPVAAANDVLVRLPAVTGGTLPVTAMPKVLAAETGSFFANASAQVVIGADDSLTDCKAEKATIRRGIGYAQQPEAPLALDVCALLQREGHFHHAAGVDGRSVASVTHVSVHFSHTDAPPIYVVAGPPPRTSGHVLSETGEWADSPQWVNLHDPIVIAVPDWSAALTDRQNLPKAALVGVKLKLTAKNGLGSIGSCKVVLASGDARLDAVTCKALTSSIYTDYQGRAYAQTYNDSDAYPVLVRWHGESAEMTAPAMPTVPHMPKDVPLTAADKPSVAPPLQAIPIRIALDTDGHATGCTVMQSSGDDGWDAAGCRIALQRARFTAPLDGFGRPAKGLYEAVADWVAMTIHPAHQ